MITKFQINKMTLSIKSSLAKCIKNSFPEGVISEIWQIFKQLEHVSHLNFKLSAIFTIKTLIRNYQSYNSFEFLYLYCGNLHNQNRKTVLYFNMSTEGPPALQLVGNVYRNLIATSLFELVMRFRMHPPDFAADWSAFQHFSSTNAA